MPMLRTPREGAGVPSTTGPSARQASTPPPPGVAAEDWPVARDACWARCALGVLVLGALAASDSGAGAMAAVPVTAFTMVMGAACRTELEHVNLVRGAARGSRGRRMRDARSLCDFLVLWLSLLSHLAAAATCARTLSAAADHVSGGSTRKWLFGYETKALGEPWPDVIGVTIVIVVCVMFMCGLENSFTFTIILIFGTTCSVIFFVFVGCLNVDTSAWRLQSYLPTGWTGLAATSGTFSYAFPSVFPSSKESRRLTKCLVMVALSLVSLLGVTTAFSFLVPYREITSSSLPMIRILEVRDLAWARPVMASFIVISTSLALTEIFPNLFQLLLTLAGPEWKVLTRSLTYESSNTGSPVLAVFTAGSLSAILAFACPLAHLVLLMNACPLLINIIQAVMLILLKTKPSQEQEDMTDVRYKRLGQGKSNAKEDTPKPLKSKLPFWFLPRVLKRKNIPEILKSKKAEEKECLLLDEYEVESTPNRPIEIAESEVSDGEQTPNYQNSTDDESSTDIDAIVKEYQDRVTVVTSVPVKANIKSVPCKSSFRKVICGMLVTVIGSLIGTSTLIVPEPSKLMVFTSGLIITFVGVILTGAQPTHCGGRAFRISLMSGPIILCSMLLAVPLLRHSWPAISLFSIAGVVMYVRCDKWCSGSTRIGIEGRRERIKIQPSPLASRGVSVTHVDTILITRQETDSDTSLEQLIDIEPAEPDEEEEYPYMIP